MPRLYSYVVLRDFGFAPNPFHGVCTLATCKADIRRTATIGDYIIGVGTRERFPAGKLVYAMRVDGAMSFDEYWSDPNFAVKKAVLNGSRKRQYGDNIYHHVGGNWLQEDSHHSLTNGQQNLHNLGRDTKTDRILTSEHFIYWGRDGPFVPDDFRNWNGYDVAAGGRGHQCRFPDALVAEFGAWLETSLGLGYVGRPFSW